jgi:ATP-dependent Clp protease protease subunit
MNRLQRLLIDNRGKGLFRVDNKAANEATIYLYGAIVSDNFWGDGIAAIDFVKALAAIDAPTIHLRIDSPGGEVFAGQSMAQAIREHPANVIAHIDGLAASAASWVALAANEVVISPGGMVMIHQAQGIGFGNAGDLRETADLLDKIDAVLLSGYASETGQSEQQLADWMSAETWFNAEEAVTNGFADRVASTATSNRLTGWNLAAYDHAPAPVIEPDPTDVSPAPTLSAAPPHAAEPITNTDHLRRLLRLRELESA